MQQLRLLALSLATVGVLSACGGSGGDAAAPTPPAPAPTPGTGGGTSTVTLTGVVATGAAMANAAVSATCATGTASATSASNGSYTINVTNGALPCVLQATSSDGHTALRSVAPAGASSANITPLTELLVAQLSGQEPAAFVAGTPASQLASVITANKVADAQTAVVATLSAAGVDTSTIGDFVSGTLVAAVNGSGGNGYDQALDALAGTLSSAGTTLATLTTTVAATAGAPATTTASGSGDAPSLPSDLLLKSKAPNCATLASTTYRLIKMAPSLTNGPTDAVTAVETATIDAATLTLANPANPNDTWTWTANGACRYSSADGADIVVSPAGVVVARAHIGSDDDTVAVSARNTMRMVVGLPVQSFAVADLQGTWNYLSWIEDSGSYAPEAATFTVDAGGAMTQMKCTDDAAETAEANCTTDTTLLPTFTSHADGGFTLTSTDPSEPWSDRVWVYRSGNGELMLVALSPDGELTFATKQRTLGLPTVGESTSVWNLQVGAGQIADTVSTTTNTTTAVNSANGSYTRNNSTNGSTVTVPQTVVQNSSRNGYAHRLAATGVTASDGSSVNVREAWFMSIKGFGLTALYLPSTTSPNSNARFGLSVKQP